MSAELNLVTQLAIILIAAGIFTVISKALKQPLILGYIVAGFIVGPNLGLFPQFSPDSVHEWSELGIIFLLFGLGLEFSFKKLLNVGSAAIIAAGTICIGMFLAGFTTGSAMGWSTMESIFMGGMLSMSSTTIIIKAYDDLGIKKKPYATLVFGLLVVEDLIAVLIMVLLSTLAVSNKFSGADMLLSLGKLVSFLVLCFLVGIFVIPTLFKKAKKYLSDEILLLVSVGLCFLMVILANLAGFSSALGAFLMGSILSSTIEGTRIEHITGNIKNLFGAIFFVSVGMMVNPAIIAQHWSSILIITVVVMCGILLFSTMGVLFAGKNLDTALHVGFSLPQLGEFSFIIAGLGVSLGVLRDFIYPVIISVSVITTFTTPYMIKAAEPVSAWMHKKLPSHILNKMKGHKQQHTSTAEKNYVKEFGKKYLIRVGIYGLLLEVLFLAFYELNPIVAKQLLIPVFGDGGLYKWIELAAMLVIMLPFIYGLVSNNSQMKTSITNILKKSPQSKPLIVGCDLFRTMLALMFVLAVIMELFDIKGWVLALVCLAIILTLIWLKHHSNVNMTILEKRFYTNLNEKENLERSLAPVTNMINSAFEGRDIHLEPLTVLQDSIYAGKKLLDIPFRKETGVNIIKIARGKKNILIPSGNDVVFPGDTLLAVGTTEQLEAFDKMMKNGTEDVANPMPDDFMVEPIVLSSSSILCGKMLKDTNMRANGCMVISIVSNGLNQTNPKPDYVFKEGDIVWIAGIKSSVEWYK